MLVGVVSDVHSDVDALSVALRQLASFQPEKVVSVGDVIECTVPKAKSGKVPFSRSALWSDELPVLLNSVSLVSGNQEERITRLTLPETIPVAAWRLLEAPPRCDTGFAVYQHGHDLEWQEVEPDRWVPTPTGLHNRLLVHGHHHRNSLIKLNSNGEGWNSMVDITPDSDMPVALEPDFKYLLNVGPAQGSEPSWALVDDADETVTLHYSRKRFQK